MGTDADLRELRENFEAAPGRVFTSSPLYQAFCTAVAEDAATLRMLSERQPGQQAPYLLFAAVHYLLLRGAKHPLADVYAAASRHAPVPADAGKVLIDFVGENLAEVRELVRTRLVQTNVVRRSVGLRYALSLIAELSPGPVHLVEVGASAGIHLNVDRYRFEFGSQHVGPPAAAVTIRTELLAEGSADLTRCPEIASRTGIDLRPVSIADPDQRLWLRTLVWPENGNDAELLHHALDVTAALPPRMITGDAVDVCPMVGRELPAGQTRVVFHAATRMHVPRERWAAFDEAIDGMGRTGPLFHVWHESAEVTHSNGPILDEQAGLYMHGPNQVVTAVAEIDGHGAWIKPLAQSAE